MSKNLVIVESPAKAKTIEKYLGKDFIVKSSYGHIADLSKKGMGIDIDNNFEPEYKISEDKKEVVKDLKKTVSKVDTVWLASDEDREGEAIAWHLAVFLDLEKNKVDTKRIVFNEITEKAILNAVDNPREIDYNLVNAQQARRVLDRLVGFELSPVLWRKIRAGLSAGRVQSVAVRLIVERENEVRKFKAKSSYKITAEFLTQEKVLFNAELKTKFTDKQKVLDFLENLKSTDFEISNLSKKDGFKNPSAPFTTSTLQQEASQKLGYSVSTTMQLAQRLYEAGRITYMRTDSVSLSQDARNAIEKQIIENYGDQYYESRTFKNKNKGAQEAHEAVRPTNMAISTAGDDPRQERLYNLIWKRTIASQMTKAKLERTIVEIKNSNNKEFFEAKGEVIVFDGFLKLYVSSNMDEEEETPKGLLPRMNIGERLGVKEIVAQEKFSKAPARFTEASLVKKLEELGIGRPSTYAPTISTIQRREYVEKGDREGEERNYDYIVLKDTEIKENHRTERFGSNKGKIVPTEIGSIVNDFLVANFENVLDYSFTARVEESFDAISQGKEGWSDVIQDFYGDFHDKVEFVKENAERATGERLLGTDPKSGKNVYVKVGRFGPMAQIGEVEDEEKPKFAGLRKTMLLAEVTLEQVMQLFKLPLNLGKYKELDVEVNEGRFGPYVKYDEKFISLGREADPFEVNLEQAIQVIKDKEAADAPIYFYEELPVQKGTGRFGPFIKWNNLFINITKKYDFDNLSNQDIETLIEDKKRKEIEKVIHNWEEEGISVQKARWGRFNIIQGKTKIELPKTTDVQSFTLEDVQKIIEANKPKKKATKKKAAPKKKTAAKKTTKKAAAKKTTVKKTSTKK